jgi:tetratricopeptide (TPR) repeat protein
VTVRRLAFLGRLALLLLTLGACGEQPEPCGGLVPASATPTLLVPGSEVARAGAPLGCHRFELRLERGDFVEVEAEQHGADLELRLLSPAGRELFRADRPTGSEGTERALFVAPRAGRFALILRAGRAEEAGGYALRVRALRPAVAQDRARAAAARQLYEADSLRRAAGPQRDRAAVVAGRACAAFEVLGDERLAGDCRALELQEWVRLERWREAAVPAQAAAERWLTREGEPQRRATVLRWAGQVQLRLGEPEKAAGLLAEALRAEVALGRKREQAVILGFLGELAVRQGNLGLAGRRAQRASELWADLGDAREAALARIRRAGLLTGVRQPELALVELRQARELLGAAPPAADLAFWWEETARAERWRGEWRAATAAYEAALLLRREGSPDPRDGTALAGLAQIAYETGSFPRAQELYREAVASFERSGDGVGEGISLQGLAWSQARVGGYEAAAETMARSLELARRRRDRALEEVALYGLAWVDHEAGRLEPAWRWITEALPLTEALRATAWGASERGSLATDLQTGLDLAVEILLARAARTPSEAPPLEEAALAVSERGRARWLLDEALRRESRGRPPVPSRLAGLAAERAELERWAGATNALEPAVDEVLLELRRSDAAAAPATPLPLETIRRELLGQGELLLHYDLGRRSSWLWVVGHSTLAVFPLGPREPIETAVDTVLELLAREPDPRRSPAVRAALEELSRRVLPAELSDRLARAGPGGPTRWLVSGDGALARLPWAALRLPAEGAGWWIERGTPSVVPSASAALALRDRSSQRRRGDGSFLVVADPAFEAQDRRHRVASASVDPPTELAALVAAGGGSGWRRLPHTADEAKAIGQRVGGDRWVLLEGASATKSAFFTAEPERRSYLHLATHGLLDAQVPELSGLVLASAPSAEKGSSYLWSFEVATLVLRADLVVLSACQTGLGRELEGEGPVGLAHAFLRAGATQVLASLWPVEDRATARLMDRFYEGLLDEKLPPAEALRRAQLAMSRSADFAEPFYWAGFVLLGAP